MKVFYRVAHINTKQGLWYNESGDFTGLIHTVFDFCKNKELQMPFDAEIVGFLSATDKLEDLFHWFTKEDIERLEMYGFYITVYAAENYKQYANHWLICEKTSTIDDFFSVKEL